MSVELIEKIEVPDDAVDYLKEMDKHDGIISRGNRKQNYLTLPRESKFENGREECYDLELIEKAISSSII